jgi:diacylglycerol kinase
LGQEVIPDQQIPHRELKAAIVFFQQLLLTAEELDRVLLLMEAMVVLAVELVHQAVVAAEKVMAYTPVLHI